MLQVRAIVMATLLVAIGTMGTAMAESGQVIDDFGSPAPMASNGSKWEFVSDRIMGGVSSGALARTTIDGRTALQLRGTVSLANNGGFLQMALNFAPDGGPMDASSYAGIKIDVIGNGHSYNLHLRTTDLNRPWQSYRHTFRTTDKWTTIRLPFAAFKAHRTDVPLNLNRLRRLGMLAIGDAFEADFAVSALRFYRVEE